MTGIPLLSILLGLPLLGALLIGFMPESSRRTIQLSAIGVSAATFIASLLMYSGFNGNTMHFQFRESVPLVPSLGVSYSLGVDGVSIWLVLLTTLLTTLCLWFSQYVTERAKAYNILMLLLEVAMLGVFMSLDMVLFFIFFEMTLVPMYFLIAIWGGANRAYASIKFFLFTAAASIFMLLGILTLWWINWKNGGGFTFDIPTLQHQVATGALWANFMHLQALIFWSFALGFLVKMPVFPFHTWLPDAHVEAPTAGSIILAGVLLKMGTYGFLRFCLPFFPDVIGQMVTPISILAVIGILYGGAVAAVQPDVKKLVAYSSVAHMGFVLLGIISLTHEGLMGGAMQQLNHGISTGALFLLIGLIYERRHTRQFKDFGGLKAQMPIYAALMLITMLSSVGLPGLNGFVGEFLALMGAFRAGFAGFNNMPLILPVLAATGVIIAAVYLLIMFMRMFYGPNDNPENQRLKDLKPWEIALAGCFVVFMFWGGLSPNTFLKPMERSLGAVRLMAINPAGQRPSWQEADQEIDATGQLVRRLPSGGVEVISDNQNVPERVSPEHVARK